MKSKKIVKNSAILFVTRAGEGAIQLATLAIVARYLGAELFGEYAFVVTVSFFFSVIISFGTGNILIREISKDHSKTSEHATVVLLIRLLLSTLLLAIVVPLTSLFSFSEFIISGIYIMLLAHFSLALGKTFEEVYMAHERMGFILIVSFLSRLVGFSVILLAYLTKADILFVFYGTLIANTLRVIVAYFICKKFFVFRFKGGTRSSFNFYINKSKSLFGATLLRQFNIRVDVFLLQTLATNTQLALYHAPHRIFMNMQAIPFSITSALFPRFSQTAKDSMERLADDFEKIFKIYFGGCTISCLIGYIWADEVILLLFSDNYSGAIICFKILVWVFLTGSINALLETMLIVVDKQREIMFASFLGLVINIILDIVLIPKYHAVGASYATMASYLFVMLLMLFYLTAILHKRSIFAIVVKICLVAFCAIFFAVYFSAANKFLCTSILVIIFVILSHVLNIVTKNEILFFINLVKRRRPHLPPKK